MDLTDNKIIKVAIDEIGDIHRMITCLTRKGDLLDVAGATTLLYCSKCRRHSFKKYTSKYFHNNCDEKTTLWASDLVLKQLLNLVGVSVGNTDADIASAVLPYGNMLIQHSELRKEIILVMKP
ncbi:unnamed protein product [Rotaria magnacalcarata]|nr:unnamed protein product [Rotaria magnacalcarata]CAF1451286.1 unnamed protein product [Rotaria magnacalcarata]